MYLLVKYPFAPSEMTAGVGEPLLMNIDFIDARWGILVGIDEVNCITSEG